MTRPVAPKDGLTNSQRYHRNHAEERSVKAKEYYLRARNDPEFKRRRAVTVAKRVEAKNAYARARYATNPNIHDAPSLKKYYGITVEDRDRMMLQQHNCCKSCGTDLLQLQKRFRHIDHCHKTGVVRGILCFHCNVALGNLHDDPIKIKQLLTYMESYVGIRKGK